MRRFIFLITLFISVGVYAQDLQPYTVKLEKKSVEKIKYPTHIHKKIELHAQEFHPYKIKSGKITFEKRRYAIHTTMHIDSNDNVTGTRSNPSYVEDEIVYYWDNYGDIAFEVAYQVSKFGGKPLPQKVKKYERLWKGNHRYYYDVKKKKLSDDPYYTRKECLKAKHKYETEGWFAVMYPKAKFLNEESVSGKMAKHYKESAFFDFYVWQGLFLREMNYSTKVENGKDIRFEPETERVAVSIDTQSRVNKSLFTPSWLK
ncbi:hypothetical protein MNB_SV-14-1831 [hydrothermal vent metagenome]|uniref:Uncharacterized protein n=1 Tax=hydrothermal vent metagenome TaxID=652676 RepID=A0A1W1BZM6_9ZZZZ